MSDQTTAAAGRDGGTASMPRRPVGTLRRARSVTLRRARSAPANRLGIAQEAVKGEDWAKEMRGSLLVVASLLTSVTYQAGLNPPGGVWQDSSPEGSMIPHRAGNPVLQDMDTGWFKSFHVSNFAVFVLSVCAMMLLIMEPLATGWGVMLFRVNYSRYMLLISLLLLGVAFASGSCRNWSCNLFAVLLPFCYFLIGAFGGILSDILRRRLQKYSASTTVAQQVLVAVFSSLCYFLMWVPVNLLRVIQKKLASTTVAQQVLVAV